ncbi:gliding motility-associated C-terminal domain-containing protein [Lutibacter sp.]|uniref:gliding motility-associated C-terminal domain-containing protein n=1 Tax=Lutibacter sp. TaxID=1925666 RepID=UPI0035696CC0
MKRKIKSISKLYLFLSLFLTLFVFQSSFSQCATGDAIQDFCAVDNKTVGDLIIIGNEIVWFDAITGGNQYNPDSILLSGSYFAYDNAPDPSCTDTSRFEVVVTIYGTAPTDVNVFVGKCASENARVSDLTATATIGGVIEWYDSQSGGILLSVTNPILEDGATYWVQQTENGCTSNRLPTTVTIINPPTPTIVQNQSFCSSINPTISDLQAAETNVLWYSSEFSTSALNPSTPLINGEDYWATQVIFPCESTVRIQANVIIDTAPNAGTNGSYTECEINLVDTNLFLLLGGSPETTGTWTTPDGSPYSGNFIVGTDLEGTYTYTVPSTLGVCTDATATVIVTILEVNPPTTLETNQTFCEIDNPTIANLNVIGTGIIWYDSETSTTPLNLTDALIDGEDYWASQTEASGCESASRLVVTVTIENPLPPTTSEITQTFCEIDNPTITNLNVTGAGIIWYDSEISTIPLNLTDALIDGEDYWASQTEASGCESASRLVVTVTIENPLPPTTSEVNQTFCVIDNPTITNLNVTGVGIIWYDSEIATTPLNLTDALIDGEDYWASQTETSGCESATRLKVTVIILDSLPPTTTEATQTFCEIDNPTIANLNVIGAGIVWYDSEIATTPLNLMDALIDGEDYWASQTEASGCESATRLVVTVTILVTLPPTTTEATQTFCEIDNPTIANLNVIGAGIIWYDSEISTTPLNLSDALIDGEDYWASQTETSGCESASRLVITVIIENPLSPSTSEINQTFCVIDNPTIANLNVTGTGIIWYDSENSTTPLNLTDALIDSEDYWASQTETSGCESATRLAITVTILDSLPPTTSETTQTFCEIENPTVANLTASGTGILWYDSETSTTPLNLTDALINGEDYWASQTEASGCESASRLVIAVTILVTLPPTTTEATQTFCMIDFTPNNPTIADLNVTGNNVIWYNSETSTTPLNLTDVLVDGEDYFTSQTDAITGCESTLRLVITVIIINPPTPTTTETNQNFCLADNPTIANLAANGDTIIWYDTETATTPLNSADLLVDGANYWAANADSTTGCESISRLMITVTINDIVPATISTVTQNFCASDLPTIANLQATGNEIIWFASETDTTPLVSTELLINGEDYWAAQTNATTNCSSSTKVAVNVILTDPGTPNLMPLGNEFCKIDKPTVSNLHENVVSNNGGLIVWYDFYPNGNTLSLSELLVDGETYYAVETEDNGCSSINPLEVTVTLESCSQYDVEIYDGFSPSGNGINDTFKLGNLRDLYPDFKVEFYNRWGSLVYTANASKPDWNGYLNGNGELVPAGVYYFVIYFNKDNRKPMQRRLYLSR